MRRSIERMLIKNHAVTRIVFSSLLMVLSFLFAEEKIHVLQKGETLYGISRKYSVPAEVILEWNNLINPDKLQIGQKIKIPDLYIVVKGDTLYGIAKKLGITVELLRSSNNLLSNDTLKAGATLYIPATAKIANSLPSPAPVSEIIPQKPFEDPRSYETKKVDSSIIWPVLVKGISYLTGKIYGVSITSEKGEKVKTIASGTIISTGPYRGFGQVVFLQSKTGYIYVYGGLDAVSARSGELLAFGDELGTLGSDSLSGKPQLYFMVYNKDIPVDPAKAPRGY